MNGFVAISVGFYTRKDPYLVILMMNKQFD